MLSSAHRTKSRSILGRYFCPWHPPPSEDSCTLCHILTLCHPSSCTGERFKVNSVREFRAVLEATMKYDMENLRRVALEELSNELVLREDPVRVYALACQYEAARLAAKHTLTLPTLASAACSLATEHMWIVYTSLSPLFGYDGDENEGLEWAAVGNPPSRKYRSVRVENMSVHKWWMRNAGYVLQRPPHGHAVKDKKLVDDVLTAISTSKCKQCQASEVSETFRSFVNIFAENIERHVAEVKINLGF